VVGETRITRTRQKIQSIRLRPRQARPLAAALSAIAEADVITLGPGSLFTSIIPNLLVEGMPAAIRRSPAIKTCFVNLMWQPGETTGFRASDHVAAINRHAGGNLFDVAVVNTRGITVRQRRKYAAEQAQSVMNDVDRLSAMGLQVVAADLLAEGEIVRHDSRVAAEIAMDLARRGRANRSRVRVLGEK
jgi:uncharacterized cofD-like protein